MDDTSSSRPDDPDFFRQIADFGLKVCIPLYWHDRAVRWPKRVRGASCFAIRFSDRIVGITAAHVLEEYRSDRLQTATLVCQLGNAEFDLNGAVIDKDLDLTTFAVSEADLGSGRIAIDCSKEWPPPTPDHGRALSLVGFPEVTREVQPDLSAVLGAYGALAVVDAITDREIVVTYEPTLVRPLAGAPQGLPPLRFNMSGCSGGPAITHGMRNGLHRWFPVGIIVGGSGASAGGAMEQFDMIRIRRINRVRQDGTIDRPSLGWLP